MGTDVLMIGPAFILVAVLVLVPIGIAAYLSFTNWDGFTIPPSWIGTRNYERLVQDPEVLRAAVYTVVIAIIGTIACNALGMALALLLNRNTRVNTFVRVLVFSPYVIGPIILGFLWASILGTNGALNSLLHSIGVDGAPFLSDPAWAMTTALIVIIWASFGLNVVLYLAGLQTLDNALIEAATIDGAGAWAMFWRVKLPVLAPTVTLNIVLTAIGLLRVYEMVLALTAGGPAGTTQTAVFNILTTSFSRSQLGYGAAQSVVLMIVIIVITIALTQLRRRSEEAVSA
ncbi:carbohydrate ABC transporter permease [Microbacterium azadirachtae]|uniref:carbohydrate ABC transporter permease n=1 Tax=Microbacterium azadirachtae TaxID=582680 RepID=UPI000884F081|nr:sugar ABC transporter permease [Microbacterium azadirachtae]SDL91070.1 carbohydrate ABC transporter membrane protein 1, CUT1 family [Microbacterium azadirachtae]SEG16670.1 carbohydrate ABC transporter membrane protein 1, CUT1 family [Microbacterium azadirachtae]SEG19171.1 carbohydrate ABC transporter membrane protein 1, CUT1 family [Microbacterium azadirachtae]